MDFLLWHLLHSDSQTWLVSTVTLRDFRPAHSSAHDTGPSLPPSWDAPCLAFDLPSSSLMRIATGLPNDRLVSVWRAYSGQLYSCLVPIPWNSRSLILAPRTSLGSC